MKFAALLSAGLIAAAAIVPAAASAQMHNDRVVTRTVHSERHGVRAHRARQVCKMVNRNHHRSRVCRTVRY